MLKLLPKPDCPRGPLRVQENGTHCHPREYAIPESPDIAEWNAGVEECETQGKGRQWALSQPNRRAYSCSSLYSPASSCASFATSRCCCSGGGAPLMSQ
jgi:hypothetical protein